MTNTFRIWCLKPEVFDKIKKEAKRSHIRITLKLTKVKIEPFILGDGKQGIDIIIPKEIQPSNLLGVITKSLIDEGYGSNEYNIEVL